VSDYNFIINVEKKFVLGNNIYKTLMKLSILFLSTFEHIKQHFKVWMFLIYPTRYKTITKS